MSFTPKKFDSGKVILKGLTASATCTKYSVMKDSSGYLAAGAAGDNEVNYIGLETTTDETAVDGSTQVKVLPIDETSNLSLFAPLLRFKQPMLAMIMILVPLVTLI